MHFGIYKSTWFCRWCGNTYKPLKDTDRDGFCSPACKQAHHRAYKKYIEWKLSRKKLSGNRKTGTRHRSNANSSALVGQGGLSLSLTFQLSSLYTTVVSSARRFFLSLCFHSVRPVRWYVVQTISCGPDRPHHPFLSFGRVTLWTKTT